MANWSASWPSKHSALSNTTNDFVSLGSIFTSFLSHSETRRLTNSYSSTEMGHREASTSFVTVSRYRHCPGARKVGICTRMRVSRNSLEMCQGKTYHHNHTWQYWYCRRRGYDVVELAKRGANAVGLDLAPESVSFLSPRTCCCLPHELHL